MTGSIDPLEVLIRLGLATALGAIIGFNRERLDWAAGLRTHMLVCVGAALAMIVSAYGFADVLGRPDVVLDPSRIAAQVISGVGFLGAGTILFLQREQVIRGLTTAAGLWAVSAIGLAAGSGLFVAALIATALLWVILALLKPLERRFVKPRSQRPRISLWLHGVSALSAVETAMESRHLPMFKIVLRRQDDGVDRVDLLFDYRVHADQLAMLADDLRSIEGLTSLEFGSSRGAPSRLRPRSPEPIDGDS